MRENKPGWEKMRSKGRFMYVLVYWVLGWGLPVAVVSTFIGEFIEVGPYKDMLVSPTFYSRFLGIVIIFLLAGFVFGMISWYRQEKIWNENGRS